LFLIYNFNQNIPTRKINYYRVSITLFWLNYNQGWKPIVKKLSQIDFDKRKVENNAIDYKRSHFSIAELSAAKITIKLYSSYYQAAASQRVDMLH